MSWKRFSPDWRRSRGSELNPPGESLSGNAGAAHASSHQCVVIGLQSTGDSHTRQMISRQRMANSNDGDDDSDDSMVFVKGFISSPREILLQLLDNAFPTIQIPESLQVSKEDEETSVERI